LRSESMAKANLSAGIDIGSRSIELVVLEEKRIVDWAKVLTTFDPLAQCALLMPKIGNIPLAATGYGRKLFKESMARDGVKAITEIQAYALGARHISPEACTVLDIGGQDTKVIALKPDGRVARFEMNDRCAAGTGKFLEFMAAALQIPLESFGHFALQADKRIPISNMCTVFAETEAVSLMARGEKPANIAMGLHLAIAQRILAMVGRVKEGSPIFFAGGVAHNPCIRRLLEEGLQESLIVPDKPDLVGALGAALYAQSNKDNN
jgi:predicted CoA-substrate-specific enzyme activase